MTRVVADDPLRAIPKTKVMILAAAFVFQFTHTFLLLIQYPKAIGMWFVTLTDLNYVSVRCASNSSGAMM